MTPNELELTKRWLDLYDLKDKLYEENTLLKSENARLKNDNQALNQAFQQKNNLLTTVLKDLHEETKKNNALYKEIIALKKAGRPPLYSCIPDGTNVKSNTKDIEPDSILDLFKQSSNRI